MRDSDRSGSRYVEKLLEAIDVALARVYRTDPLLYLSLLERRRHLERRLDAEASIAPMAREHGSGRTTVRVRTSLR